MTDGRYSHRNNKSPYSEYPAIGFETGKIVGYEFMTRKEEPVAQRHETIGTVRLFDQLSNKFVDGGLEIDRICHYMSKGFMKLINDFGWTETVDRWHAKKSITRSLVATGTGSAALNRKIQDLKISSRVVKHFYWCSRTCEMNSERFKQLWESWPYHLFGDHSKCDAENSYCTHEDYAHELDTFRIKSLNHCVTIYAPKTYMLSEEVYNFKINLAFLVWNENADRDFKRVKKTGDTTAKLGRKHYLEEKSFYVLEQIYDEITNA